MWYNLIRPFFFRFTTLSSLLRVRESTHFVHFNWFSSDCRYVCVCVFYFMSWNLLCQSIGCQCKLTRCNPHSQWICGKVRSFIVPNGSNATESTAQLISLKSQWIAFEPNNMRLHFFSFIKWKVRRFEIAANKITLFSIKYMGLENDETSLAVSFNWLQSI